MEVEDDANGTVYPYCKGCHKNIKIVLPLRKTEIKQCQVPLP
jgi:hypothetical protein|nr:MAG TPA: Soluble cytochrome b562 assembly, protein cage, bimetallic [Caudoviricetes sp.]